MQSALTRLFAIIAFSLTICLGISSAEACTCNHQASAHRHHAHHRPPLRYHRHHRHHYRSHRRRLRRHHHWHAQHKRPAAPYRTSSASLSPRTFGSIFHSDILATAARYIGYGDVTGHHGLPWCKFFVNFILERTGHYWQSSGLARDARLLGPPTVAHAGAIGYTGHHAAFVYAVDWRRRMVRLLGGNQSRHRVTLSGWRPMFGMRFVEPLRV